MGGETTFHPMILFFLKKEKDIEEYIMKYFAPAC